MIWLSEKRRLVAFLSILLVSGFFLVSIIGFQVSKSALKDIISENELPLTSDNIYSEIQRDLLRPVFIASVMAQDTFLRDWVIQGEPDELQIRKYLDEIKTKYGTITSFFVSDRTLTYYHANGILKSVNPDDPLDEWYFRVRDMASEYEINVDADKANRDTLTIFVNHKVFDYQGQYIGATGVGLAVYAVQKLIDKYRLKYRRNIYFTNKNGDVVLAGPETKQDFKNIRNVTDLHPIAEQILKSDAGNFEYERDGDTFLLTSRYIPELNWVLLVEQSESEAIGGLKRTLAINLLISLVITVIVMLATVFAINVYQKRLERMAEEEKFINDQLSELNEQKDKMLAIIGHDLRSPFNAIIGYAELLVQNADTLERQQVSEYAANVVQSGRNANALLESLLGWAKFQWGNLSPNAEYVELGSIIDHNFSMFEPVAEIKNITLRKVNGAGVSVIADPDMIDLVLRNLLNNAIKFTNEGGMVTVDVSTANDFAWISVGDTGVGMSPDTQAAIFEKNDHKSTKGTAGEAGVGMGLILSRDMVEANGGIITVESEVDSGTTFRFSLPLA